MVLVGKADGAGSYVNSTADRGITELLVMARRGKLLVEIGSRTLPNDMMLPVLDWSTSKVHQYNWPK